MSRVPRCLAALLAVSLLPAPAFTDQHVVTTEEAATRLAVTAAEREAHRAKVDRLLAMPVASEVALAQGLDIRRVRAEVAALSDEELRDLAARADALQTDPVAGGTKTLIILAVIVVVAVLLAFAIRDSCRKQGAACFE